MNEFQEIALEKLGELCRLLPEQRLGQIIYNYLLSELPNADPFFIQDKNLLNILEKNVKKIEKMLDNKN